MLHTVAAFHCNQHQKQSRPIALELLKVRHLLSTPQRVEHTANVMEAGDTSSNHEIKRGLAF
jgi:hypothetical protein